MDPSLTLWWAFFISAVVVDVVLWSVGILGGVEPDTQFRLFISAALVLLVILGMLFGWGIAAAIWFSGLWIYAIIAPFFETPIHS